MAEARLRDMLEPGALHPGFPEDQRDDAWVSEIQASQAISLKRIADALTGAGDNFLKAPINSYGEGIGDAIQGQMVRGAAGISQYER